MFDWGTFRELKDFYTGIFGSYYRFDHDHHHIQVSTRNLIQCLDILKNDLGFLLLNDIAVTAVEGHPLYQKQFPKTDWDITYHLYHYESHQRFQVHLLLSHGESLPTAQSLFGNALRFENEAKIRLGLLVDQPTRLKIPDYKKNPNLSEAPYPEELNQWYLFDLNHPITKQQWELACEASGGKIINSWMQAGFWKRGWEKSATRMTPLMMQPILDGLIPTAAPLTNIAWAKTVEDYFIWKIPERAQAVRMIFMELSRISHHLSVLADLADSLGVDEAQRVCFETRERIRSLFQFYNGGRVATRLASFGGLSHDIPHGWVQEAISFMKGLEGAIVLYRRMVAHHPLSKKRLKVAALSAHEALESGITGPALRATGINFDLRKSRPFYFYKDIDFDVPVGIHGDSHDRMLILIEECSESLRILWQVIDNLPLGDIRIDLPQIEEFNNGTLDVETWKAWIKTADRTWGAQFTGVEGANGELAFHLALNPNALEIWALKIKTNAQCLAHALPVFLKQCSVADLSSALATINIEASALDR
ncbi:MAG: hypothetical protein K2P81_02425 [Bacteriovoracaceae bacterium]|nr:hypothetical protein [Bacteriovoracaceae bacterium]